MSQFVTEIATISTVQHRNLVKLYGCYIEGSHRTLVYEYLENKSLDQALFCLKNSILDCLRNEVLLPLYKVDELYEAYESKDSVVEKYLEEVKAGKSKIAPDALIPNQNVRYVNHWNFGQVAELQWKAMMEGIKKQGKINDKKILNNCLASEPLHKTYIKAPLVVVAAVKRGGQDCSVIEDIQHLQRQLLLYSFCDNDTATTTTSPLLSGPPPSVMT
ncbi:unnamed protein product [Prunus armeniaca]|uniref:Uncharacterized protein n=1 Tax=Prunus armeniaca TaxID=36596 RepID=A0A6J5UX21_PRUAR|nr:unnamed protein product [Prunus armeniaca]CAB4310158.1 unnamed protein product [Prunus armeniaca]